MKSERMETEDEVRIILFVLIPHCKSCRERVKHEIMRSGVWARVEIGYPEPEGSPVSLIYKKGKYPDVDYWELAKEAKTRLDELGYRVI